MPTKEKLKKYADILVKFALNGGEGIKKGEVVFLQVPESAREMLLPLQASVLEAGGYPIFHYIPEGISRDFFLMANDDQLVYFPKEYMLGRVKDADHLLFILADENPKELEGIDSQKIMLRGKSAKFYMEARSEKENQGKLSWTLALFGTEAMAKEANLSLEEYWQQISDACFLDLDDPISKWREILDNTQKFKKKLDDLQIEYLEVQGEDVDLKVKLGDGRKWLGGGGRNIPSFEVFISPDWRGTEGWIKFNQPLYRYGSIIRGIELEFENGVVVNSKATENEKLLKDMIATENADKIGEFSLTDRRFSRITKFMAQTLFDENMGGDFGNTHIALGNAYKDSYTGDPATLKKEDWANLGYNDSAVHTDIISTSNRKVTAVLKNGERKVIYENGEFTLD